MSSIDNEMGGALQLPFVYHVSVVLLVASIVLGGATTSGYMSDVLLQYFSIPPLLVGLWFWSARLADRFSRSFRHQHSPARIGGFSFNVIIGCAIALCAGWIILCQLLPTMGQIGLRGLSAHIQAAGGLPDLGGWHEVSSSIDPAVSLASVASVLPALGVFLLVALLDTEQRFRVVGWLVVCGLVSLAIGVLQVMQGPDSLLRFYNISNRLEAIGFFVNRNHFSAFLYTTLVLGICWFAVHGRQVLDFRHFTSGKAIWFAGFFAFALLTLAGIALARSRAGILLALVALAGIVAMSPTLLSLIRGKQREGRSDRRILVLVLALLLVGVGQMGGDRFLHRFDQGIADSTRALIGSITLGMAGEALPAGTGLGTFPSVYAVYEEETLNPSYVNRAHNDWAEFLLETGVPGALLIGLFLVWFAVSIFHIWVRPSSDEVTSSLVLRQGASLTLLLILLHSFIDYPLRTEAMVACFAVCCVLMMPPCLAHATSGQAEFRAFRARHIFFSVV